MKRMKAAAVLGLALATVPGHPSAQSALEQLKESAGIEAMPDVAPVKGRDAVEQAVDRQADDYIQWAVRLVKASADPQAAAAALKRDFLRTKEILAFKTEISGRTKLLLDMDGDRTSAGGRILAFDLNKNGAIDPSELSRVLLEITLSFVDANGDGLLEEGELKTARAYLVAPDGRAEYFEDAHPGGYRLYSVDIRGMTATLVAPARREQLDRITERLDAIIAGMEEQVRQLERKKRDLLKL